MNILEVWWDDGNYESSLHATPEDASRQLKWLTEDCRFKRGAVTIVTDPNDLELYASRARRNKGVRSGMTPEDFDLSRKLPQHPTLDTTRQQDRGQPGIHSRQSASALAAMRNTGQTDFTEATDSAKPWLSKPLPEVYAGYDKPNKAK